MLTAYDKQNRLCELARLTVDEIEQLPSEGYSCPACQHALILKKGTKKQAHFAHQRLSSCRDSQSGESLEHQHLKKLLSTNCAYHHHNYQVEPYLPKLKQRPDILVDQLALEIQCSSLSIPVLRKRNRLYTQYAYQAVWLSGPALLPKQQRLSPFHHLISQYSQALGFYFWSLDSQSETLTIHHSLKEWGTGRYTAQHETWALNEIDLIQQIQQPKISAPVPSVSALYHFAQLSALYAQLQQQLFLKCSPVRSLQLLFYAEGLHLLLLPMWFYYPALTFFGLPLTAIMQQKLTVWLWLKKYQSQFIQSTQLTAFLTKQFTQLKISQQYHPAIAESQLLSRYIAYFYDSLCACEVLRPSGTWLRVQTNRVATVTDKTTFNDLAKKVLQRRASLTNYGKMK